jgi:hypothetical protein
VTRAAGLSVLPDRDEPIAQRVADLVRFGDLPLGGRGVGREGEIDGPRRRGRCSAVQSTAPTTCALYEL